MDVYWNPFRELDVLRRGIDDLFTSVWPAGWNRHSAFLPGRAARGYPLMNLAVEDDRFVVEAFAPGLDRESLEITIDRNVLTVSGQKKENEDVDPAAYHRRERAAGNFVRTLHLDCEIDEDKVAASYADGILHITLPKAASALPRKVAIEVK